MKSITSSKDATRTLSRMPSNTALLIRTKLTEYAADPLSLRNNVRALRGEPGGLRLRVGDWRVLFIEPDDVVSVIKVASRGRAYD